MSHRFCGLNVNRMYHVSPQRAQVNVVIRLPICLCELRRLRFLWWLQIQTTGCMSVSIDTPLPNTLRKIFVHFVNFLELPPFAPNKRTIRHDMFFLTCYCNPCSNALWMRVFFSIILSLHSLTNGLNEESVQIVKRLWGKSEDFYQSLMVYRVTPLESGS